MTRRRDFVPWLRTATDYVNAAVPFKARWVMFHLISEADYRTGRTDSSYTRIAESLGIARNTVMAHVQTLQSIGEVIACPSGSGVVLKVVNYDRMTGQDAQVGGQDGAQVGAQELSRATGSPAQVGAQVGAQELSSDSGSHQRERRQDLRDPQEEEDREGQEPPPIDDPGSQPEAFRLVNWLDVVEPSDESLDPFTDGNLRAYSNAWARCRRATVGVVPVGWLQQLARRDDGRLLVLAARGSDPAEIRARVLKAVEAMEVSA